MSEAAIDSTDLLELIVKRFVIVVLSLVEDVLVTDLNLEVTNSGTGLTRPRSRVEWRLELLRVCSRCEVTTRCLSKRYESDIFDVLERRTELERERYVLLSRLLTSASLALEVLSIAIEVVYLLDRLSHNLRLTRNVVERNVETSRRKWEYLTARTEWS